MKHYSAHRFSRGSVTLVVLCVVAVLGIALASFLAVGLNGMKLSNRTAQSGQSRQLAEIGLEEALRAFSKNDWSNWSSNPTNVTSGAWTLDTTNKRATRTLTFDAGKLGQGVTGTVKIRIDNYDAAQLSSTWSAFRNYSLNDLVGYNGIWYRCLVTHSSTASSQPPNLSYWAEAPIPWTWSNDITYSQYDVVHYGNNWYRYINISSTSGNSPTNTSYWVSIQGISLSWSSVTSYAFGSVVYYSGAWYYCINRAGSGSYAPTNTSYWAPIITSTGADATPSSNTYAIGAQFYLGDYIYRSGDGWYRCIVSTNPYYYASNDYNVGTKWVSSKPFISWMYHSASPTFSFNDVVYYGGNWYRGKVASPSSTPPGSDWENALNGAMHAWSNGSVSYNLGDVVYYNATGQWYRCVHAHTSSASYPPDSTTYPYWTNSPLFSTAWDPGKQYGQYDTVRYNGTWYLSLQNNNAGQIPSAASSTYWAIAPQTLSTWNSTANYSRDDVVSYSGSWYRCILSPTSNQVPTNTTYWSIATGVLGTAGAAGAASQWNSTTTFSAGSYASYGGVWYKCTTGNTGRPPNNTSYWTPTWTNSFGVITGAPVVYAEGTIAIQGSPSIKTQLRAPITPAPFLPNAIAATSALAITGSVAGVVDSYDSSVNAIVASGTSGGTYTTLTHGGSNIGYSAVLAATGTASSSIQVGNSTAVKGYVAALPATTYPYAPLASFGTSATIKGATSAASPNVDLTRVSRSPYIPKFDILSVPGGTTLSTISGVTLGTPGATIPSIYYYSGNLTLNASSENITINGPVILYITGRLQIVTNSNARFVINSTGSLRLHVARDFQIDSSGGGIVNNTNDPKRLSVLLSRNGTDTFNYSEPHSFYGTIYLPDSSSLFTVATGVVIYGALSVQNLTFSNEANVHYDTSLRYATFGGVDQPYTVSEWRELDITEQATMP